MGEVEHFAIEIPFRKNYKYKNPTWAGISSLSTNGFRNLLLAHKIN
jgi:hypothetical protein